MSLTIRNVRLAYPASHPASEETLYVKCKDGKVEEVGEYSSTELKKVSPVSFDSEVVDGGGGLLLPSLCHAHMHLDTCYSYRDKKDARPSVGLIYARATRLIRESVQAGVTTMRAHVEVDESLGLDHVVVALILKEEWKGRCDIRLCLFMQHHFFAYSEGKPKVNEEADKIIQLALKKHSGEFSAIGSAPFVEDNAELAKANVKYIFKLAKEYKLHVDLHLDDNLASGEHLTVAQEQAGDGAMIWDVLSMVNDPKNGAMGTSDQMTTASGERRTLTIGHEIRLSLFSKKALEKLKSAIVSAQVHAPVYLVALPPCDVYSKGRNLGGALDKCRATLNVVKLTRDYEIVTAMAVGCVQNNYAPQGHADPLELCPIGVMLYQTAEEGDARILLESITLTSRLATGIPDLTFTLKNTLSLIPQVGNSADFVILHENTTLWGAGLDPGYERTTVYRGKVVGWRKVNVGVSEAEREERK